MSRRDTPTLDQYLEIPFRGHSQALVSKTSVGVPGRADPDYESMMPSFVTSISADELQTLRNNRDLRDCSSSFLR